MQSDGYRRDGRTRGYGTKVQRKAANRKLRDDRSESVIRSIQQTIERTSNRTEDIASRHRNVSDTERKYMSVQGFYLTLQVMAPDNPKRKEIITKMIAATLEPELTTADGNARTATSDGRNIAGTNVEEDERSGTGNGDGDVPSGDEIRRTETPSEPEWSSGGTNVRENGVEDVSPENMCE